MSQGAKSTFQARSRATRDKLIAALEELLKTKQFDDISVAEIAAKAGVSPASIYRRFENKDAFIPVLFELYQRRIEDWTASPEAKFDPAEAPTLRDALRQIALIALRQLGQQRHILRAVHIYAHLRPDLIGQEWRALQTRMVASFSALLTLYRAEIKRADMATAAGMTAYFINTIFIERGLFWDADDVARWQLPEAGEAFAAEVADFVYGYLTTPEWS